MTVKEFPVPPKIAYSPATLRSIHRLDILEVLNQYGLTRPQIAAATLEDKFPTVLIRAIIPAVLSDQDQRIYSRDLSKLFRKPVMLRNKHDARDDDLQRLAHFESI